MASFLDHGIRIPAHKTAGTIKVKCPKCGNLPKHKGRNDLSVNISEGLWKCHSASCGWTGSLNISNRTQVKKEYTRPVWQNNTDLTDIAVKYFESRGIPQFTLRENKVTSGRDWMPKSGKEVETIHFNYFLNGELINIKYRGPGKDFRLHKDAKLIMYGLDWIKESKDCYIVEGEIDQLSIWAAGINHVISVPNGASMGNSGLEYIDNSIEYLDHIERFFICTDTDTPGINLRNELIRRLGPEKCFIVELEKKDANEYLCEKVDGKYRPIPGGKEKLLEDLGKYKEVKIDGVFDLEGNFDEMLTTFRNGKVRGTTTYFQNIDQCWTWRFKEVTLVSGYNNEGKTNLIFQLAVLKAYYEDWKFGLYSPENMPMSDLFDDLIHCYVGIGCDKFYQNNVMTEQQYIEACDFINNHFYLINPDEDNTIENIFEKTKFLISRKGIKALIIDPYNQIDHMMERGEREDLYISRFMSQLKRYAVKFDLCVVLIAHQTTPLFTKDEDYPMPDRYKIKGGGTFSDKADNVLIVWRPYRRSDPNNKEVRFIACKIKKQRLVGIPGEATLYYSRAKNQYFETIQDCEQPRYSNIEVINIRVKPQQKGIQSNLNFDNEPAFDYNTLTKTEDTPF